MAVRLSALRAGHPLPPGRFLVLISVKRLSEPQGHSAAGRIRSTEKSNDIGNRTRDLPACSIAPRSIEKKQKRRKGKKEIRKKFTGRPEKKLIKKMREECKKGSKEEKHKQTEKEINIKKNDQKRNKVSRT
jgi:hypothetical protein